MDPDPLDATLRLVLNAPESGPALTLYALVSTLEHERAGCLFKLTKRRDLDPGHRVIAYGLMEMMADGRANDDAWRAATARMDAAVRG